MRRIAPVFIVLLAVAAVAGVSIAADPPTGAVEHQGAGGLFTGVKPTAVGLPQLGATGTIGASDMASQVQKYHDSGQYSADLTAVATSARQYLAARVGARKPVRRCTVRYTKVAKSGGLYKRSRRCRLVTPAGPSGKPAIVLDIDETSLSNYAGLLASGFSSTGTVVPAATGTGTAILLINVGDQESDLDGGHADRAFKLPNPFYFIAD